MEKLTQGFAKTNDRKIQNDSFSSTHGKVFIHLQHNKIMDKSKLFFVIVLLVLGIYLLGQGVTGLVVSESCCFPPNCGAEENACVQEKDQPRQYVQVITGFIVIVASFGIVYVGREER